MGAVSLGELFLVKHGSDGVLGYLLKLLNVYLSVGSVSVLWKRAWISIISKPYNWNRVLMNTQPIALIETARKIFSKIFSDRISSACSKFSVLCGDNFFVLKSTFIQSPVFAVGLVVKDALKKDHELWLLTSDKICDRFIRFFSGIHSDRVNRVIINFGLTGGYKMCNCLDQDKVFSPFLWKIFYDSLLCKVKRHEHLCGYQINTKFVARTGKIETCSGLSFFFAAGVFYALNIASEFFAINNISINNKKTVVIPINQGVKYLGIFLSTKGLSKPSVAKAYLDVCFFINMMLKKAVTNKQFSYLVSAVLQFIVSYRTQFSFVLLGVYHRSKAHLLHDFSVETLYYPSLYDLKSFEQVQSEYKLAVMVSFSNASGILRHLFNHRFLDLQILGWALLNFLQFSVKLHVSPVNNFLAGVICVFYIFCRLDLKGPVPFWFVTVLKFLLNVDSSLVVSAGGGFLPELDVLNSVEFSDVQSGLHKIWSGLFDVYTDNSLKDAGTANIIGSMTAYFSSVNLSVGGKIQGLLSSTLSELQAVALTLECIPSFCVVVLHLDSQAAIDVCVSEMSLAVSDFCVISNMEADVAVGCAICFKFSLFVRVCKRFLVAEVMAMSGNVCHFVRDADPGWDVVLSNLVGCMDWSAMVKV
ncbi:hypothetical protein G9A89_017044 [Geosiphon pyriformis]|nr:hypothetical protein G9A89_017044 [Geosiphon pyriformis]